MPSQKSDNRSSYWSTRNHSKNMKKYVSQLPIWAETQKMHSWARPRLPGIFFINLTGYEGIFKGPVLELTCIFS